ncbi:MAG: hypothetical protein HOM65_00515 [Verrucomicrobia bacterium]|nr:hypothetical protein [Verrucomicrobiota bacterium]
MQRHLQCSHGFRVEDSAVRYFNVVPDWNGKRGAWTNRTCHTRGSVHQGGASG